MKIIRTSLLAALTILTLLACAARPAQPEPDPLPGWNPGPARQALVDFVAAVTGPQSPDFVPEAERIAVFDNDGTLWAEQPLYFQMFFTLDRVAALAPEQP